MSRLKQISKQWCPPALWAWLRQSKVRRLAGLGLSPADGGRVAHTLEQLDMEIARVNEAGRVSDDALRQALAAFRFDPGAFNLPSDPDSAEYRAAQMNLYRLISARSVYDSTVNEHTPLDLPAHIRQPFPYSTKSFSTVGEQLMGVGFLIRAMGLASGGSILEFGPGWGLSTLELALMGYEVTAVDVNPLFVELIRERARRIDLGVTLAVADMLLYKPEKRYDRVLFYECFHHCADHEKMIARLDEMVAPGGAVIFAAEPIIEDFYAPWGVRLDGMSAWSIRRFGWLELGFRTDYFRSLLLRHGWNLEILTSGDVSWMKVFVARRTAVAGAS